MRRSGSRVMLGAVALATACGCGAHGGKAPPPAELMRAAITPVATSAPAGVLAPAKYVPSVIPVASKSTTVTEPSQSSPAVVVETTAPQFGDSLYVEVLPETITRVPYIYPPAAWDARVEGTVMVQALVGVDGNVRDVRVAKSIPMLDEAAKACVMQWKFKPALSNNKPVAFWMNVPVKFSLK